MKKLSLSIVIMGLVGGCSHFVTTTDNPTDPEADSPIIIGEVVPTPWGCVMWRNSEVECCPEHWEEPPDC
jgi:hypothetical protein